MLDLAALQMDLADAIGRRIDLVTTRALKPYLRDKTLAVREVIYGAEASRAGRWRHLSAFGFKTATAGPEKGAEMWIPCALLGAWAVDPGIWRAYGPLAVVLARM